MKRLAIRAYLDSRPGATVADLAALFSTSNSVVCAARRKPVDHWAARLQASKPSPRKAKPAGPRPAPSPPRSRPGSRERAVLVEPEPLLDVPDVIDVDTDLPPGMDVDVPGDVDVPDAWEINNRKRMPRVFKKDH